MTSYVRFGAFLPDVTAFDAEAFKVARNEAAVMDPQHRLLQEATAQAFSDARTTGSAQTTGGCSTCSSIIAFHARSG